MCAAEVLVFISSRRGDMIPLGWIYLLCAAAADKTYDAFSTSAAKSCACVLQNESKKLWIFFIFFLFLLYFCQSIEVMMTKDKNLSFFFHFFKCNTRLAAMYE